MRDGRNIPLECISSCTQHQTSPQSSMRGEGGGRREEEDKEGGESGGRILVGGCIKSEYSYTIIAFLSMEIRQMNHHRQPMPQSIYIPP